ncbi:hypothetical protein BC833DRAFT_567298 [Globomyces pollinis-pini]|nr:hypothetical protein BC833DRAFT_567298 [Globomyces pollinis-pini]
MPFNELYVIDLVNGGVSLTFLNIDSLKERKPGAVLQLLAILTMVMFIAIQMMILCSFYDNQQTSMYLNIVASVVDYLAAVTLGFLYTYRLQAFSCLSNSYLIRIAYILLIIPILYGIVDILSIAIVLGYKFPLDKFTLIFYVSNIGLACYMMIMHAYLSLILLQMKERYSIQFTNSLILGLFGGSLLYMGASIWGTIDPTVGNGPIYAGWSIDVLAFQYTTSSITKVLNNPEIEQFNSEE